MKLLSAEIILIGNDPTLDYLLSRFAARCGCRLSMLTDIPSSEEIQSKKPRLILFSSMENLEAAQTLVGKLAGGEIPLGVCAAVSDEARARELGADHCLVHPLTYEGCMAAFRADSTAGPLSPDKNSISDNTDFKDSNG